MSGRTVEETFNGFREFPLVGRSFEILSAQSPIEVTLRRGSEILEHWQDVEAGAKHTVRDGEDSFNTIEITTAANETVKFAVSDGLTEYDPRPQWHDRNPVSRMNTFGASSVAPHGVTTRWTYTVPAGKKFYCQFSTVGAIRQTAPTVAGIARGDVSYDLGGAGTSVGSINVVDCLSSAVDGGRQLSAGSSGVFLAGDVIRGQTTDLSTDGTMLLRTIMQGIEFNA